MKCLILLFAMLFFARCTKVERVELPNHVSVHQIAYIDFSRADIHFDFPGAGDVDVLCHALNAKSAKVHSVADLDFACVSSLEQDGLQVLVDRIECAEDVSHSDLVAIVNPIRLDGCTLTPRIEPLPADFAATLDTYKLTNEWLCRQVNCSSLHVTMHKMVHHAIDILKIVPSEHFVCAGQICYVENASTFEFYKKLFSLIWFKK